MMGTVRIISHETWGDCDCCGGYEIERHQVFLDGELIPDHHGDGHIGGGVWYGWEQAVADIMPALGHSIEIEGKPVMSLGDWFAGHALAGWLASYDPTCDHPVQTAEHVPANIARWSYDLADAMLRERTKRNAYEPETINDQ